MAKEKKTKDAAPADAEKADTKGAGKGADKAEAAAADKPAKKPGKKKDDAAPAAAAPAGEAPAAAAAGDAAPAAAKAADDDAGKKKIYKRIRHKPSKRVRKDRDAASGFKVLALPAAVKQLKTLKGLKFDQTVECILHLGVDPKQNDQIVRGAMSLPHGIGKTKKVIVFCPEDQAEKAKAAGAIEAGLDALSKKISEGWTDFDVAVATPDVMAKIARLGRVLGPQGKMPNPKSGTVDADVVKAVKEHSAGKIQFRTDAGGNVHAVVGKFSFDEKKLIENITAFLEQIKRVKPSSAKGQYLKQALVKGTMTPAVFIDPNSIAGGNE